MKHLVGGFHPHDDNCEPEGLRNQRMEGRAEVGLHCLAVAIK